MIDANPTAQQLASAVAEALTRARAARESFLALPDSSPAAERALAFDRILAPLNGVSGPVHLFSKVHPDSALRAAADEAEQQIASFQTGLSLDRELYEHVAAIRTDDSLDLDGQRLVRHALRDYRRSGVDRDAATRERIRALQEELVLVGQEFERNIIEGGRSLRVPEGHRALAGLPEDFLRSHPEDADGSVTLSTDPQDRIPVLTYAHSGELRRAYWRACMNRAVPQNLGVLHKLLALRAELAGLLGFRDWADYATEDKMVGSGANARDFLRKVVEVARPGALRECADMLLEKRELEPGAEQVNDWDRSFLVERIQRKRFGCDSQRVRSYFPYAAVRDGVLATTQQLYGIEFVRQADAATWHESVDVYEVREGGRRLGRIYLDMHPRAGKYKHAAMFDLQSGIAGTSEPVVCLVCNFPRPSAGDPALLLHDQVTTFFHEFGHLLHHLFAGAQRYLAFSGTATEWDFVEVPSQLYEEWAWDARVLRRFARHPETGEALPEDLIARMRAADEYGKAIHVLVQMFYATLALDLHSAGPAAADPTRHMIELKRAMLPFPHEPETYFHASFGHLHGYSALYYTYMWSLVISKDVRGAFDRDLLARGIAQRWREHVLSRGGQFDARDLVRSFLGREFDFEAFRRWLEAGSLAPAPLFT